MAIREAYTPEHGSYRGPWLCAQQINWHELKKVSTHYYPTSAILAEEEFSDDAVVIFYIKLKPRPNKA
ncbi:hypothetical protein [Pinibacter soli]|uniref:Uncharacterized protein n=1 Tax=Pinibacter soli TaxID=3044211 RepID=A0ABT6RC37_9BACT|nr:hypothetical protein [Pinibacter soli]MDI3319965.1 hypothetical protein [Pinibacter soli]